MNSLLMDKESCWSVMQMVLIKSLMGILKLLLFRQFTRVLRLSGFVLLAINSDFLPLK